MQHTAYGKVTARHYLTHDIATSTITDCIDMTVHPAYNNIDGNRPSNVMVINNSTLLKENIHYQFKRFHKRN